MPDDPARRNQNLAGTYGRVQYIRCPIGAHTNSAIEACRSFTRPLYYRRMTGSDTPRLHRSELAVPGSNVQMLERAPDLGADIVMLDLEDAVAPDDKERARINIIDALNELDWSQCSTSLRINGLDTHYAYRDIV